jgi:hypothetical protein
MLRLKYREYFSDAAFRAAFFIFDTNQNDKKEWDQPQAFKAEGRADGAAFHDARRRARIARHQTWGLRLLHLPQEIVRQRQG